MSSSCDRSGHEARGWRRRTAANFEPCSHHVHGVTYTNLSPFCTRRLNLCFIYAGSTCKAQSINIVGSLSSVTTIHVHMHNQFLYIAFDTCTTCRSFQIPISKRTSSELHFCEHRSMVARPQPLVRQGVAHIVRLALPTVPSHRQTPESSVL